MFTLRKLYFEPNKLLDEVIEPIIFEKGINLIVGERSVEQSTENKKTNGVGKSILVEAVNFCLFKDIKHSRINRIPEMVLGENVFICLDVEIETKEKIKKLSIKRSRDEKKPIRIIEDGVEKEFKTPEEAGSYIESLTISGRIENRPSWRNLLTLLIREESTSYESILYPSGKSHLFNFSDLLRPHLYLFGFNLSLLDRLKELYKKIKDTDIVVASLNSDFKKTGYDASDVRSYINELESMVQKLELATDGMQPAEAMKQQKELLNSLEQKLDSIVSERTAKSFMAKKIKSLPQVEEIDTKEIKMVFDRFQSGLGSLVKRSFDEVLEFQGEVFAFQNKLMTDKLVGLEEEISILDEQIDDIDSKIADIYKKIGAKEQISSLKKSFREYEEKNSELERLKNSYLTLEKEKKKKEQLKKQKTELLENLSQEVAEKFEVIEKFESDLKEVVSIIAGTTNCQFQMAVDDGSKEYLKFEYRMKNDGSSGVNRMRVFIYDVLLMLNNFTSKRHLGFLVHDNIFASVDRDGLVRSLNYLHSQKKLGRDFQYILTINKDEFDSVITEFEFKTDETVRAGFTRSHPFLGQTYKESEG